jgi:hypothetical protein
MKISFLFFIAVVPLIFAQSYTYNDLRYFYDLTNNRDTMRVSLERNGFINADDYSMGTTNIYFKKDTGKDTTFIILQYKHSTTHGGRTTPENINGFACIASPDSVLYNSIKKNYRELGFEFVESKTFESENYYEEMYKQGFTTLYIVKYSSWRTWYKVLLER